jgi:hypothetical protein
MGQSPTPSRRAIAEGMGSGSSRRRLLPPVTERPEPQHHPALGPAVLARDDIHGLNRRRGIGAKEQGRVGVGIARSCRARGRRSSAGRLDPVA